MRTPLPDHYVVNWAVWARRFIELLVDKSYPQDAHNWPLLRAFDAQGHVWGTSLLVLVLRDKLSGIPAIGQADDISDPGPPTEPISIDRIAEWLTALRAKLGVRARDALMVIPIPERAEGTVNEQWESWSEAEKALWHRQLEINLTSHYYLLRGFDLTSDFFIPPGYQFLADDCHRFFEDHPDYAKNVFIMTRLASGNRLLEDLDAEIRQVLRAQGLDPVRADDKMYLRDRNLWNNVCLYMICCQQGIAILEDRIADEFDPNVALEYGFMRGLNRAALLLKDVAFRKLRADIMGTLWEEFNITDIKGTIKVPIEKWLRELGHIT